MMFRCWVTAVIKNQYGCCHLELKTPVIILMQLSFAQLAVWGCFSQSETTKELLDYSAFEAHGAYACFNSVYICHIMIMHSCSSTRWRHDDEGG